LAAYFRIRNWEKFQHYKDRAPPWIKLHRDLLTSRTWVSGDDASRALAVACMLLAAATDNKIPADAAYVRRVAYLNSDPDLAKLADTDFIEFIDENGAALADASNLLAKCTECSPGERREEERREEERREEKSRDARKRATRLPEDWKAEQALLEWARSQRPDLDPSEEQEKFRDYYLSLSGHNGTKLDWTRTFRNWIRNSRGSAKPNGRASHSPEPPRAI
jgi:replicative superfamily II helicase